MRLQNRFSDGLTATGKVVVAAAVGGTTSAIALAVHTRKLRTEVKGLRAQLSASAATAAEAAAAGAAAAAASTAAAVEAAVEAGAAAAATASKPAKPDSGEA